MMNSFKPYAGSSDPRWRLLSQEPFPALIGGELVHGPTTEDIISPRDKTTIGSFSLPDDALIDRAVASARDALQGRWQSYGGRQRAHLLLRLAELLAEHADEFAFLEAVDCGRPVTDTYEQELAVSLEGLHYFAGRAQAIKGISVDTGSASVYHRSRIEPIGVVLEILPWNGPLWTGVQRLAAILAAGNTAIIKPAECASAAFLRLAQVILEAGFPPGVVSVVPGSGSTVGEKLVRHPGIDLVSLTGGTATGIRVLQQCAPSLKRVSLELGGKNPNIVLADADLGAAISWSAVGAFSNSGQICVSGSRIFVAQTRYGEFVDGLSKAAVAYIVGDPLDPGTQLGPVISQQQFDKVTRYIAEGKSQGRLVAGGLEYDDYRRDGWYISPTIFADVDPHCSLASDEIFGPVVTITPFNDVNDAIRWSNASSYGLAAGVFTSSLEAAAHITAQLQAGEVYVNQWFSPGSMKAPSLGYKQSGYGAVGMEKYQQNKNIFTRTG